MSSLKTLPNKSFLVVIHADNLNQTKRNVTIAHNEGANGVFLINHNISSTSLCRIYLEVKNLHPNFWIGLNFLDLSNERAMILANSLSASGLWIDNLGIDERLEDPASSAKDFAERREGWSGANEMPIFGGVAFKYQTQVIDLVRVTKLAIPYADVITTSGSRTGVPADIGKIETMKKTLCDHPLAVASGITPENVNTFIPFVDYFLVATGISFSHTELNPLLVNKLAKTISSK